jgi:hypothetical protein
VSIVNDIADVYGNGVHVARLEYPQAVAFDTDGGVLMLDKEVWFSEITAIKRGDGIDGLLYDDSASWEDRPDEDPTTHYEFLTEMQEL